MIRLCSQNRPQFRQSLLHWSQISFPISLLSGQQRASSRWGPDLENMVGEEAIRSLFHSISPSFSWAFLKIRAKLQTHYFLISSRCQLSHETLIYDRPKLFYGLLLFFLKQLMILCDQSVQRHRCLYDRV